MPIQNLLKNTHKIFFLTIHLSWHNSMKSHYPRSNNARLTGYFLHPCAIPPTPPAWHVVRVLFRQVTAEIVYTTQNYSLYGLTANGVNDQLSCKLVFGEVIEGISRKKNEASQNCYNEFGFITLSSHISPKGYTLHTVWNKISPIALVSQMIVCFRTALLGIQRCQAPISVFSLTKS